MPSKASPILQTKLLPPQPAGPFVPRPELMLRLDRSRDVVLTLISAPAGSGKTRLVTEWIRSHQRTVAWVSLQRAETDLARFVTYLVEAIRTVYPEAATASRLVLNLPTPPSAADAAEALLQDLEALPGPLVLVLDDFHDAESRETLEVLQRLLRIPPPLLHLILTTRADPSLPLARLRSQYQLVEIRNADLRFSAPEASHFLGALAGKPVDAEVTALLHDCTEGWPVGLQLAGILLQGADDPHDFAAQFTAHSHHWVAEYLVDEVVANLPPAFTTTVQQAALFDRFCASLLDAVVMQAAGSVGGHEVIAYLTEANLFIIPLDEEQHWYRFHHLFRDLLLQTLVRTVPDDEILQIHQRAALWFEAHGLTDDAINHAQAAHDDDRAVRLIETNLYRALNDEDARQLDRWLDPLPESLRQRPALLVAQAYRLQWRFQMGALPALLDEAEAALTDNREGYAAAERAAWQGAIASLRALVVTQEGNAEYGLKQSRLALQLAPPDWKFVRGLAELAQVLALQMIGEVDAALATCRRGLAEVHGRPDVRTLRLLLALCGAYYTAANADEIVRAAATYLQLAQQLNRSISIGWAHFSSGWGHYQLNNLDGAEADFRALIAMRRGVHVRSLVDGYVGLALTLAARDRFEDSQTCARELRDYLAEMGALSLLPMAESLIVRLRLMRGEQVKLSYAGDLMRQARGGLWEFPLLTVVRACVVSGNEQNFAQADAILARYRGEAHSKHRTAHLIELDALAARLHIAQGATDAALEALARAVTLARPGGVVRMIVDEGPSLVPYLEMLVTRNIERPHVQRILAAYEPASVGSSSPQRAHLQTTGNGRDLRAELTFREMEVLGLIAQHRTNDEIADELVIALPTVKRHTSSILKKLGVSNRRQAASRALALGLVAPPDAHIP